MTIIRHSPAMLARVSEKLGPGEPTIDQRLCDALFDSAIRCRCHSPKPLWEKASLRVVDELENAVRQRCARSRRAWHWTPKQRRSLAEQIRVSVFNGTLIDELIHNRAGKLIRQTLWRINERHIEFVEAISHEMPTTGTTGWLLYWANKNNECTVKDRDIVKKPLSACWWIGYSVTRWRELCSKVPIDAR